MQGVLSRDKTLALTAGKDGAARLWNVKTGLVLRTFAPAQRAGVGKMMSTGFPNTAVFSSDEQYVLTADTNHQAYLWSVKTGKLEAVLSGHTGSVQSACFSADGTRIMTAGLDATARIWDLKSVVQANRTKRPVTPLFVNDVNGQGLLSAGFSPDGQHILVGCKDGTVKLYPATLNAFLNKATDILHQVPPGTQGK